METINKQKNYLKIIINSKLFLYTALTVLLFAFLFSNIVWMQGAKYSVKQVFDVLKNPTQNAHDGALRVFGDTSGKHIDNFISLSENAWAIIATLVASVGLALSGLIAQSLTKNPLADASTLGIIQAGIFGLLIAIGAGWSAYYIKFIFVIIGVVIAALLLFLIITISKGRATPAKIILAGLAIGIIFKTFSFFVKHGDSTSNRVSFNYTLGGAESINKSIGNDQWLTLYISSGLIIGSLVIFLLISRWMTILELGDDKAKQLGVKVKTTKIISVFVLIISIPSAVILVGNLAFVGLFAAHISRYLFKTRNYAQLLLPSIMIGSIIGLFGIFLTNWLPEINSGLWMTFLGAPYIIYAGIKGLR